MPWNDSTVMEIAAPVPNATVGGPFGSNLVSRDYVPGGVPVIRGENLGHGRWIGGEFVFVSPAKAESLSGNLARAGDIVFTQRGTLGQVAIIPQGQHERYLISQSQMKLTPDASKADLLFLYYLFTSPEQQSYIRQNAIQTGVPHTNLGILRATPICLPPLSEQNRIGKILGSIDDKIELNRRMNETLEAMARAIFKSWFVDFDPVRAKSEGRKPAGMDEATAALFPNAFQPSPLGPIPRGWQVSRIGEEVTVVGGSTPRTDEPSFWGGSHAFATPKDLAGLASPVLLDTERQITAAGVEQISSGILPKGTVLLSSRAPIGYLAIAELSVSVNQGFIAMVCNKRLPNHYVLNWATENMPSIEANANGTTFLEVSKANFRPIQVLVPEAKVLERFTATVQPLYELVVSNLRESRTLATTRDTLLPKLLSGELSVTPKDD